jgi:hypothetical protein
MPPTNCPRPKCFRAHLHMKVPAKAYLSSQNSTAEHLYNFSRGLRCLLWDLTMWQSSGCQYVNMTYLRANNTVTVLCECDYYNTFVYAEWAIPPPLPHTNIHITIKVLRSEFWPILTYLAGSGFLFCLLVLIIFPLLSRLISTRLSYYQKLAPDSAPLRVWAAEALVRSIEHAWIDAARPRLKHLLSLEGADRAEPLIQADFGVMSVNAKGQIFWDKETTGKAHKDMLKSPTSKGAKTVSELSRQKQPGSDGGFLRGMLSPSKRQEQTHANPNGGVSLLTGEGPKTAVASASAQAASTQGLVSCWSFICVFVGVCLCMCV